MAYTNEALIAVTGSLTGFVLGLIGGGGSVLAVPLLVYLVGVPPHMAIGTSAIAVAVSAFANLIAHARAGHVKWNCAIVFALAGIGGAMIGSSIGKAVDGQKLLALFGAAMIVIAAAMFLKKDVAGNPAVVLNWTSARRLMPLLLAYGAGAGALSGFFGIGGGFLVVPGILAATGMPLISAVGSSLVSVTAFGLTTAVNYAISGLVDWQMAAIFIGGGILGGIFGGQAAKALANRKQLLAKAFAVIVAGVGIYVLAKPL
ncbi:MAG: sulfite exporter TauE/SafE family protein [Beijerinckiaceae bacterium]|nr:sulfite exporter TauE/SafE family protein [Beijerinckiaceae bacterium]